MTNSVMTTHIPASVARDDHHGELLDNWTALLAPLSSPEVAATGRALLASWAEPSRRYHDTRHLQHVLDGIEQFAAHAEDFSAVQLAAWYHDAEYHGAPDDETHSATRADTELTILGIDPQLVSEVSRLVRLTATHDPTSDDADGQVLCDADLAILASASAQYARYTAPVHSPGVN